MGRVDRGRITSQVGPIAFGQVHNGRIDLCPLTRGPNCLLANSLWGELTWAQFQWGELLAGRVARGANALGATY